MNKPENQLDSSAAHTKGGRFSDNNANTDGRWTSLKKQYVPPNGQPQQHGILRQDQIGYHNLLILFNFYTLIFHCTFEI